MILCGDGLSVYIIKCLLSYRNQLNCYFIINYFILLLVTRLVTNMGNAYFTDPTLFWNLEFGISNNAHILFAIMNY